MKRRRSSCRSTRRRRWSTRLRRLATTRTPPPPPPSSWSSGPRAAATDRSRSRPRRRPTSSGREVPPAASNLAPCGGTCTPAAGDAGGICGVGLPYRQLLASQPVGRAWRGETSINQCRQRDKIRRAVDKISIVKLFTSRQSSSTDEPQSPSPGYTQFPSTSATQVRYSTTGEQCHWCFLPSSLPLFTLPLPSRPLLSILPYSFSDLTSNLIPPLPV